jgi:hypothetical protein
MTYRGLIQPCGHYVHPNPCKLAPGYIWVQDFDRAYHRAVVKLNGGTNSSSYAFRLFDSTLTALSEAKVMWVADHTVSAASAAQTIAENHTALFLKSSDVYIEVTEA